MNLNALLALAQRYFPGVTSARHIGGRVAFYGESNGHHDISLFAVNFNIETPELCLLHIEHLNGGFMVELAQNYNQAFPLIAAIEYWDSEVEKIVVSSVENFMSWTAEVFPNYLVQTQKHQITISLIAGNPVWYEYKDVSRIIVKRVIPQV